MSDEYTPTLDEAREWYALGRSMASKGPRAAEFDRMIEAVRAEEREKAAQYVIEMARLIEQARAEAWDEGAEATNSDVFWHDGGREYNPYRNGAE